LWREVRGVRALYVSPLRYGANPSVDAFAHIVVVI